MNERELVRLTEDEEFVYYKKTVTAYQEAFAGFPWYEELSGEEIQRRLDKDIERPNLGGVWVIDDEGDLMGTSWYYDTDKTTLEEEKGEELSEFARKVMEEKNIERIVWHSMTLVSPKHQKKGVGTGLKEAVFNDLQEDVVDNGPILYLTRIRDDNVGSQKMNTPYGLKRTGVKTPSSQVEGLMHEYWYKVIAPEENES